MRYPTICWRPDRAEIEWRNKTMDCGVLKFYNSLKSGKFWSEPLITDNQILQLSRISLNFPPTSAFVFRFWKCNLSHLITMHSWFQFHIDGSTPHTTRIPEIPLILGRYSRNTGEITLMTKGNLPFLLICCMILGRLLLLFFHFSLYNIGVIILQRIIVGIKWDNTCKSTQFRDD